MSEKNFEIANHRSNKGGFHMKKSTVSAGLFGKIIAVVLLCCLVGGFAVAGSNSTALAEDRQPLTPAEVYEQNVNSTVGITISGQTTSRYGYGYTFQAAGSGFIITSDGYILTNYHVIADSEKVTVATYDNETYDAKVIGYDESNDIAVLKIEAEGLKPVTLGDSNSLRVGDTVLAIGNPLGELTFSLTRGIVSALSRSVAMSSGSTMSLIQTDCAINSGNSGGALFNEYGEVIGITNAKYSSSGYSGEASIDNIGFAIPINSVNRIVTSIIENGYILKPYIGVTVSSMSEETANITGIKSGAVVHEVTEDAPAARAGIKAHDVITKVDDTVISSSEDLVKVISDTEPGSVLRFYVYRQGKEMEIDVTVESKTESATKHEDEAAAAAEESANQAPQDGQRGQQAPGQNPYYYEYGDGNGNGNYWGGNSMEDFFRYFFGY